MFTFLDGRLDWQKESALCVDFLNGDCAWNMGCTLKHNLYKTPYLWHYKESSETSWKNYDKKSNENIERSFCNPSQTRSGHKDDPRLEVWFQQVPTIHETNFTNGSSMLYRRLSTSSSVKDDDSTKLGETKWKWYWQDSQDVWEEYKTNVSLYNYLFTKFWFSFEGSNIAMHIFIKNITTDHICKSKWKKIIAAKLKAIYILGSKYILSKLIALIYSCLKYLSFFNSYALKLKTLKHFITLLYAYLIVSIYIQDATTNRYKSHLSSSSNSSNNNIENGN